MNPNKRGKMIRHRHHPFVSFYGCRIPRRFLLYFRHVLSRHPDFPFFAISRKITFRRLSLSRTMATTDRLLRTLFTNFRAYFASLRRITATISGCSVLENRWTTRREWGGELSCEKKRDKADRPPSMMAVAVVAYRVFRRRVSAIFSCLIQ